MANLLEYEHHDEGKGKKKHKESGKNTRKDLKGVMMIVNN